MKVLIVGGLKRLKEDLIMGKNIHVKYVTCGRPGCRCQFGQRHGPYYYHRRRMEQGKYKDVYVKPSEVRFTFDFSTVGDSDILLDVKSLDHVPELFNTCPAFIIER